MNSETPGRTPFRSQSMCDMTVLNTPKPQASSTVNRKSGDSPKLSASMSAPKLFDSPESQSPAYLSNAISEMKELSDQLGTIPMDHKSLFNMPPPPTNLLYRTSSAVDLHERRESVVAESDADSSLGILRLDNEAGYSETEDMGRPSEVLAQLKRTIPQTTSSFSHKSLLSSGMMEYSIQPPSSLNLGGKSEEIDQNIFLTPKLSNISVEVDLNLRLQKALARHTLGRSDDSSVRASQVSDLLDDSICSSDSKGLGIPEYTHKTSFDFESMMASTLSPDQSTSFRAYNIFTNMQRSQASQQESFSSESFQPAEQAMNRLARDENSWRLQFGDLPIIAQPNKACQSACDLTQHLTQNLEVSAFSGIINGDVTVNSSLMDDFGRRRISMGEYFRRHTENLGEDLAKIEKSDERPNFGKVIHSPTRNRPYPLVNINSSRVSSTSVDEVPTRDAGLNAGTRTSLDVSLDFSIGQIEDLLMSKDDDSPSKSCDLMPPPAPVCSGRENVSSRLSTSLPIFSEADGSNNDADISAMSLDNRRESIESISEIAQILSEMSGSVTTRCLVDKIMNRPVVEAINSGCEQEKIIPCLSPVCGMSANEASNTSNVLTSSENVVNQRVSDWMSCLNNCSQSSIDDPYMERSQHKSSPKLKSFKREMNGQSTSTCESLRPHTSGNNTSSNPEITRPHSTPKSWSRIYSRSMGQRSGDSSSDIENHPEARTSRVAKIISNHKDSSNSRAESLKAQPHKSTMSSELTSTQKLDSRSQESLCIKPNQKWNKQTESGNVYCVKQPKLGFVRSPTESEVYTRSVSSSVSSGVKNLSRRTDTTSIASSPLLVDSTHTQLSWASVPLGSSVTQTFSLRNRARARTRLLVSSVNPSFKLIDERGETLCDLSITLHSEETRRIHVVFTPSHSGPAVGKLVIRRLAISELGSCTTGDKRLIPLFAFGGVAELYIDGASKDRWSQLFLNMCLADAERQSDVSDVDTSYEMQQMSSYFSVRNTGSVPAFVSLQVDTDLPFEDSGVYVIPQILSLIPGQCEQVCVRFEPNSDVLQCLNGKSDDMHVLANLWLSWSELSTWQRIRRVFLKNYTNKETGPLSKWGPLYTGELGVAKELCDKQDADSILAQAVRRIKVTVLVEKEKLSMFDLDSTLVFQQLVANETAMLFSPPETCSTNETLCGKDSPLLSGNLGPVVRELPQTEHKQSPSYSHSDQVDQAFYMSSDLVINTAIKIENADCCLLRFPITVCDHKSSIKVRFINPSSELCEVSAEGAISPFSVSTASFHVPAGSYFVMRMLFRPHKTGLYHCSVNICLSGRKIRCYQLEGECIEN